MIEIKVRKPKPIRFLGFTAKGYKYASRWNSWYASLPNEGDIIELTWMPDNNRVKNAYIGFKGKVEWFNKNEGQFALNSETGILICNGDFNYVIIRK